MSIVVRSVKCAGFAEFRAFVHVFCQDCEEFFGRVFASEVALRGDSCHLWTSLAANLNQSFYISFQFYCLIRELNRVKFLSLVIHVIPEPCLPCRSSFNVFALSVLFLRLIMPRIY